VTVHTLRQTDFNTVAGRLWLA